MKKLLMILLCVLMIAAVPTVAFAEETVIEETTTEVEMTITERVVEYVKENAEGILAVLASIGSAILVKLISGKLSASVSTLNNNSITIAKEAEDKLGVASKKLEEYAEKMTEFLSKYEKSEDEKKALEEMMTKVMTLIETSKLATVELSAELSELLLLANIPNAKKEELYARHKVAMHRLEEAEGVINND